MRRQQAQAHGLLTLWLTWLLASCWFWQISASSPVSVEADDSCTDAASRGLLVETTLYCNITGTCKPCLRQHLTSEACKPTSYAEHLACGDAEGVAYQTTVKVHRRSPPKHFPLHVSRSCQPRLQISVTSPDEQQHADDPVTEENPSSSDSSSTDEGSESLPLVNQSAVRSVGSLNLLYFEVAMLVVLSGALPVVYMRKRRYVRL